MRFLHPLRHLLIGTAAALCAALTSHAAPQLQVGYMPIMPDAQTFVITEGLTRHNPLAQARLVMFQNGPEIVQALMSGQLDVAYVGSGPAMVARANGAEVRFVAGNEYGPAHVLALGNLARYFTKGVTPAEAIARFTKEQGRKPRLTTFPIGSVPAASLQYWLRDQTKAGLDSVQIIYQGENQGVQSLLTGAVDGTLSPDPAADIVLARKPDAKIVDQVKYGAAGAGLLVREKLIKEHPDTVRELVQAHYEASQLLQNEPQKAALAVQKHIGGGRLPIEVIHAALKRATFDADPRFLLHDTADLYQFQSSMGVFKKPLKVDELFDASFYDAVKGGGQ